MRPVLMVYRRLNKRFQSTHPRGVRQRRESGAVSSHRFQSTHPRGVRLLSFELLLEYPISIHAPTWGATWCVVRRFLCLQISIHAPTWGATPILKRLLERPPNFNPRTHVGCDLVVSRESVAKYHFNPRSHVGCDWHHPWP